MLIRDVDAVGFTFNGENLCRYCTRDVLYDIVTENAYCTPDEVEGLGIFNLMRICDTFRDGETPMTTGTESYVTDVYDSGEYPKPFEEVESEEGEQDQFCMNPECGNGIEAAYFASVRNT